MRLSFTRFATELGALQPLTTTYNLLTSAYKPLTNIYMQSMEPVTLFIFRLMFCICCVVVVLGEIVLFSLSLVLLMVWMENRETESYIDGETKQ